MQIDIPDNTTLTMPAVEYAAKLDMAKQSETATLRQELEALKAERAAMVDALQLGEGDNAAIAVQALVTENGNLKAERDKARVDTRIAQEAYDDLQDKFDELERAYDVLSTDSGACLAENKRLAAQIAELTKPQPPVIEPPDMPDTQPVIIDPDPVTVPAPKPTPVKYLPAPTFEPGKVDNMYGIFISDGMASGSRRDAWLAEIIDFIIDAKVFNTVFMFANMAELGGWSVQSMSPAMRLRLNKIAWAYDTWNSLPYTVYDQAAYAIKTLGGVAIEIDDAHRWLPDTGNAAQDTDRMDRMRAMHTAASKANLPVIASYGGKTDIKPHSSMKLYNARQAYINGENPKLVRGYLTADTHIANLGAYRPDKDNPMTSPAEVRGAFEAFQESPVKGLAWYGFDDNTDLRKFPSQWNEIIAAGKVYWKARGIDV